MSRLTAEGSAYARESSYDAPMIDSTLDYYVSFSVEVDRPYVAAVGRIDGKWTCVTVDSRGWRPAPPWDSQPSQKDLAYLEPCIRVKNRTFMETLLANFGQSFIRWGLAEAGLTPWSSDTPPGRWFCGAAYMPDGEGSRLSVFSGCTNLSDGTVRGRYVTIGAGGRDYRVGELPDPYPIFGNGCVILGFREASKALEGELKAYWDLCTRTNGRPWTLESKDETSSETASGTDDEGRVADERR